MVVSDEYWSIVRSPSAFSGSAKVRALNSTGISLCWVLESGGQMMGVTKAVILTSLFAAFMLSVTTS